jgi:hypothetical protein
LVGKALLWIAVALTMISGVHYLRYARRRQPAPVTAVGASS